MTYTPRPLPMKQIATLLGVSSNQVYMWHQRRHTTGFPGMVAQTIRPHHPGDKKRSPLFDVDEVVDWFSQWDPNHNRGAHLPSKQKARLVKRDPHGRKHG